jgi:hypothetical protein
MVAPGVVSWQVSIRALRGVIEMPTSAGSIQAQSLEPNHVASNAGKSVTPKHGDRSFHRTCSEIPFAARSFLRTRSGKVQTLGNGNLADRASATTAKIKRR